MKKFLLILFFVCALLTSVLGYIYYWAAYDLDRLPRGPIIAEETSPNKTYTIKAHTSDLGATTSFSVLAELYFNKEDRKPKVIYFQYKEREASIRWKDDSTVVINNVELHLPNEKYDYRHDNKQNHLEILGFAR